MATRTIQVGDSAVELYEAGQGTPTLYLHGIYDLHTAQGEPYPFHDLLAQRLAITAPAHPGCGASGGITEVTEIEDLAFHYFDVLDALGIGAANIVGYDLGGWIAAEMAVRNPERVGRLTLIGASGLRVLGEHIGDLFMMSQPRDGTVMRELRELFFGEVDSPLALSVMPDARVSVPDEVRRYKSLTLAGRVGWEPPYLHNPKLRRRLHRITSPTLVIWGRQDRLVPLTHGQAYAESIPRASLRVLESSGHSTILEQPAECAQLVTDFMTTGALPPSQAAEVAAAAAAR